MTDAWGTLNVEVRGRDIVITMPATTYTVTYRKEPNSHGLLASNFTRKDDGRVPVTSAQFLARAWRLANDKARELGWIV